MVGATTVAIAAVWVVGIAVEAMIAVRLATAVVVVMIGVPATVVAATAGIAAAVLVEIAAVVEAGKKAEEENLPAQGLASVSANAT
jgi:hypothetical protein